MYTACGKNDTQLVSILYRTHKTLAPSSKIHSLYAFDALSRASRSKVSKLGITGDINAEKGNCATFLLKIDGILDALIQDMMSIGTSEAKVSVFIKADPWLSVIHYYLHNNLLLWKTSLPPWLRIRLRRGFLDIRQGTSPDFGC